TEVKFFVIILGFFHNSVIIESLDGDHLTELSDGTEMIRMKMADDKIVNLRQPGQVPGHVVDSAGIATVVPLPPAIHQQRLFLRSNDECRGSSFHINKVNVQSLVGGCCGSLVHSRPPAQGKQQNNEGRYSENPPSRGPAALGLLGVSLGCPAGTSPCTLFKGGIRTFLKIPPIKGGVGGCPSGFQRHVDWWCRCGA